MYDCVLSAHLFLYKFHDDHFQHIARVHGKVNYSEVQLIMHARNRGWGSMEQLRQEIVQSPQIEFK